MHRRSFLVGCGCFVVSTKGSSAADTRYVGFLSSSTTDAGSPNVMALREALAARGFEEGKNLLIEYQFAGSREQLSTLARELVNRKVEIILAAGSEAIVAAREATRTIPIVMTNSGDAVRQGFVASLARPGGNITGMTQLSPELAGKRLQILQEVFADLKQVGILWNPIHSNTPITYSEIVAATEKLNLNAVSFEVKTPEEIDSQLRKAANQNVRAFLVLRDPFTVRHRRLIVDGLHRQGMLAVFETPEFLDEGGLMSFGADFVQLFRDSAFYVERILNGASPADLPVQQPTKFNLSINTRIARERGIQLPISLVVRADQLIDAN